MYFTIIIFSQEVTFFTRLSLSLYFLVAKHFVFLEYEYTFRKDIIVSTLCIFLRGVILQ